ncbi:MAG: hypothetical protein PVSMB4_02970 [Ktedonobacterales bacterium]
MAPLKLYADLASWWPLLSPPEEYAGEARFFLQVLGEPSPAQRRSLVEFGSGGGSNAFHLKGHVDMTLVDIAPQMLAVSQAINPECEHRVGDMRSVRLGRVFDVVFIHDAIMYMTTAADLRLAIETAFVHCAPGGVALIVPDHVRETFEPGTEHGGRDGAGRGLRYLEWTFDPNPADSTYLVHYAFLLRTGTAVHVEHDEHEEGLFASADWLRLLREVGFAPRQVTDEYGRAVFLATKPLA